MTGTSAAIPTAPTERKVTAGPRATYTVFAGLGLAGSTWSSLTGTRYSGFVGGPPLSGFLGNETTVGPALLVIAVLMPLSAAIAGTTRRSPDNRTQSGSDAQAHTAAL